MTRREFWVFIGEGGGRGEMKNSIINTCFMTYCSLLGDLCTENIIKEKNGQVLSKPQMRLLLKKSWRYPFANPDRYIYIYIYLSGFVKTWLKKFQVHFNYLTSKCNGK